MATRILWHATPIWRLPQIARTGLDPERSKGKWAAVWLYEPCVRERLTRHLAKHHGVRVVDLVHLQVRVDPSTLRRRRKGVWLSPQFVYPVDILDAARFNGAGHFRQTNSWRMALATAAMEVSKETMKQLVASVVRHLSAEGGPL